MVNWRTQFIKYCYGWWAATAAAPVATLQSNWIYWTGFFLWFLSMLIFFFLILFLSLDSHLIILSFTSYICFQRCLNLLAAWIELRFLISSHSSLYASFAGWNTIFMRIFDSLIVWVSECVSVWLFHSNSFNKTRQPNEILTYI